jgi:PPOX class probable F420-dependent enzyme
LATIGPDDEPQVTALWFLFEDDVLRMSINTSRQKLKNLQRNPACSAFFIDRASPYRTVELRGTVEIEDDPDYAFADKVGAKYGSEMRTMDKPGESRAVVTLAVEKVHTFG